jgi:hypothetical protein
MGESTVEPKKGFSKGKGCLIIVGVLVALMVVGAIAGGGEEGSKSASTDTQQSAAAPEAVDVTAADLSRAFQENEAKAKLAYDGKVLRVSGKVKSIDLDFSDEPVIKLAGAGDVQGMGVNSDGVMTDVNVSGLASAEAASVNKASTMTFLCKGSVTEVLGSAQLSECTINQ